MNLRGLVGEVEHGRLTLGGMRAIETRQRLHGVHATELLVHVHGVQQRLIETGLKLVGHDQKAKRRLREGPGRLGVGEAVHAGFGVRLPAILHDTGERHECLEGVAAFGQIRIHGALVAHRVQARTGHDHGLGTSADLVLGVGREVLDTHLHLLRDGVRVQLHERLEQVGGLRLVVTRIVLHPLQQPPVGRVRGVVAQHVVDEPLLDRLAHGVAMERLKGAVLLARAEQFERLLFRRGREREERQVG